ncbi:MAG: ABC transporter ATP-binding protein/permease [Candidatus Saccharibacteria bacterium]|nr:ABC transporter ATP-binding protein/permease [Candidatus Saccharibacteria bacterium]
MLELKGIVKVYTVGGVKQKVLKGLNLNFRESEFAAILGPSGSGKTTLLNIIGGLDEYNDGELKINEVSTKDFKDKDWDAYRNHRIGFVFQSYNLIPHQTILSNVRLALTLSGISKKEGLRRAKKALEDVGLKDHINKKPAQLSGGQMQRVAIARALVNNPDILLADEPTGALDSDTSLQIMELLKKIAKTKLVIMVTHNPDLARKYATRIITLKDGEITSDSNIYDGKKETILDEEAAAKKQHKTKMSFFTALSLSLNNLLTKKGRTILVAFAGSIGIIGIALIMAVSTGFQNYIDKIEHDTLTSYPLALMKESSNIAGVLLSLTGSGEPAPDDNKLHEDPIMSSALGNVTKNDLKSFRTYLDNHYNEIGKDIRLIEYEYNIDPIIYTIDATNELAKLNPNSLFSTILGSNSLMNSYSNLTSAFVQYSPENIEADMKLVAGRFPENYNEMVVFISDKNRISDFLTYSLGFHDTDKISDSIAKIMGGEDVDLEEEPLTLEYDDILNAKLRLILPADIYKYNEKYEVYEDMSEDIPYMKSVYDTKSEELKIVGIVTPDNSFGMGSGILYLPSLITHIIEKSENSEIVKRQLSNPTLDVFSNTKFGDETNDFNFEFSDLVSVDSAALSKAFGVNIDQNAVNAKTQEYVSEISQDITADISPAKDTFTKKFEDLASKLYDEIAGLDGTGTFKNSEVENIINGFIQKQSFADLTDQYLIPEENFSDTYKGLLTGFLHAYAKAYVTIHTGSTDIGMEKFLYNGTLSKYLEITEIATAFEKLSINATEIVMKKEILTKIGGLSSYLTSSFANAFHVDESAIIGAFKLNFTEEELSRVVQAMFTKKQSTLSTNLALMGYQPLDDPKEMAFYFSSFDGKTRFMKFLDDYNENMKSLKQDDKVVDYTDTTGILMSSVKTIVDAVSYVLIAFVSISLVVSSIMIGIITYISVYERTKEIGILRAIGASKHNISSIFNAETFIVGLLSGLFGIGITYIFIPIINIILHSFIGDIPLNAALMPISALILIGLSIILTLIGGLIPAKAASKKDPVEALRSE